MKNVNITVVAIIILSIVLIAFDHNHENKKTQNSTVPVGYKLVWNDEFDTNMNNWIVTTNNWENAPIDNGSVLLTANYLSVQDYISRVQVESKYSFQYGYIEARGRLSYVYGVSNDLWLMPADGGSSPEMDILERPGKVDWCLHSLMYDNGVWDSNYAHGGYECSITNDGQYHIFGMLWEPDKIVFYVDGVEKWRAQDTWVSHFNVPMHIDMALCSDINVGCKYQGMGDATNPNDLPTNFAVDYVRVYQK